MPASPSQPSLSAVSAGLQGSGQVGIDNRIHGIHRAAGDRAVTTSATRAGLAVLVAATGLALAGCASTGRSAASSPSHPAATPAGSTAGSAPGATLDPSLQAELNEIGTQITELGNDLRSANPSPEGDPSQ